MPVYLEKITAPEGQDKADLEKLYGEYLGDAEAAPEWLATNLADTGLQCYAGRFNGRLLGAVFVSTVDNHTLLLQHLCVRELTRRRGFARQLVFRLQQLCKEQGGSLRVEDLRAPDVLWQQLDFTRDENAWSWSPE